MYRKIITDGDLMLMEKPWWNPFGTQWIPRRNLSEEVRLLKEHRDNARVKAMDLSRSYAIASKNIADELETLQLLLLDNSEAWFEVGVDNSILEEREGIKYNFGSNNKKGQSSSNNGQQQNQQKNQSKSKGKQVGLLEVLANAKMTLQ